MNTEEIKRKVEFFKRLHRQAVDNRPSDREIGWVEVHENTLGDVLGIIKSFESELAELKERAIVPKFKIGQEVWRNAPMGIESGIVSVIFLTARVGYLDVDYNIIANGVCTIRESELFASQEEAEASLRKEGV